MQDDDQPFDDPISPLHGLLGSGRSRVSTIGAMRARDVSRTTPTLRAAAEDAAAALIAARLGGQRHQRPPRQPHPTAGTPGRTSQSPSGNAGSSPVRS
jgi:hypothetical protein